jgi:uncharacterized membrane protein
VQIADIRGEIAINHRNDFPHLEDRGTDPVQVHGHLQEHIELIAKHEQDFLTRRTASEKLGDRMAAFIGSLTYVAVHVIIFALWIIFNTLPVLSLHPVDPFPFPLMDTCLAFEAILVASFILMRQSRMSRRAEERDQLMLQILLLTEREITAVLGMERQIAERMGLHKIAEDEEITQLSQATSIDEVAHTIKESLPKE